MMNMWDEMKNIKAPDELKARTRAAVREEKGRARQPVRSMRGGMKRLLAAACAFAVVLGGAALSGRQTGGSAADEIVHTFGLVAYAAETDEMRQPKESKIVFDYGSGVDDPEKGFYSGCLFKVTGEDIKTVSATIDRGAVYRTKTVKDTSADRLQAIAHALGRADGDFLAALAELQQACGVDKLRLSDYGIKPEDAGELADNAASTMGALFRVDPRILSREEIMNIITESI